MDKNLDKILLKNEKVLWSGASAPFPLLDKRQKNGLKILIRWAAAAILSVALLWAYVGSNEEYSGKFVWGVLLVASFVVLSPMMEQDNVMALRYVITDRRVLLIRRGDTVSSLPLSRIDDFRLVTDESPEPCLVIGTALYEDIGRQLRWRSCHPKTTSSTSAADNLEGLVLYNLPDAEDAAALLDRLLTSDAA